MSNASDFIIEDGVLKKYVGPGGDVVIPEGITHIADSAFWRCSIESVVLPQSICSIGRCAFSFCEELRGITIPDAVTEIKESAFMYCKALVEIVIPKNVNSIGPEAFLKCENLRMVTIRSTDCKIAPNAFGYKPIPVRYHDISALPTDIRVGAAIAFAEDGGDVEDPRYEKHIKYIKSNAAKLIDLAMQYPSLLKLMCREKLITAKNMEKFLDAAQETKKTELIAMVLDYQENKLSKKQKTAAAQKKEQQDSAVFERQLARQGKIGIEGLNFVMTGSLCTFKNRTELKAFIESKGGKLLSAISEKVDYLIQNFAIEETEKDKKAKELGIEKIDEYHFNEMAGRVFVVDEQGELLQYMGSGKNVIIPPDVSNIGCTAFTSCSRLSDITIPESVKTIDECAFAYCGSLSSVQIPGSVAVISENVFSACVGLERVILEEGVTEICSSAFSFCKELKTIKIPKSVTSIDDLAFSFCEKLSIHAPVGSYAETYAKEHYIPFVAE